MDPGATMSLARASPGPPLRGPVEHSLKTLIDDIDHFEREEFLRQFPHPMLLQFHNEQGEPLPAATQASIVAGKARRLTKNLVRARIETSVFFRDDPTPVDGVMVELRPRDGEAARDFVGIGRDADADVRLDVDSVANRHGVFHFEGELTTYTDAGSEGGTRIAGGKVEGKEATPLRNHDIMEFGGNSAWIYLSADGAYELLKACSRARSSGSS